MTDDAPLRRRDELARRIATLTFDLGGLTAEMAGAGHFRLDVLTTRAAELHAADAELTELDRRLAAGGSGDAGRCSRCSAPHGLDAAFCGRCGEALGAARPSPSP